MTHGSARVKAAYYFLGRRFGDFAALLFTPVIIAEFIYEWIYFLIFPAE